MKLKYEIRDGAENPRLVTRDDWRLAATAFRRCGNAGVTPIQAAKVLNARNRTRMMIDALCAKTPTELAALVCGLLAERRIPRRRKPAPKEQL